MTWYRIRATGWQRGLAAGLLVWCAVLACTAPASQPGGSASAGGGPTPTAGPAANAPAPESMLRRVRVAYPQPSASQTPLWVAQEAGLFARYGLEVDLQYVRTGNVLTRALMAREVDIAATGGNAVMEAILQGIDLVVIASASNVLTFVIFSRPDLTSLSDLMGRPVGLYSRGSLTETALRVAFEVAALDADRVELVPLGGAPEVLAAMNTGLVAAGVLSAPFTIVARQSGYRELLDVATLNYPFLQGAITTTRAYAAEQPATVTAFLKGYLAGIKLAREDPEQAKRAIARYTQTDAPDVLDESYRAYAPTWEPVPAVPEAAIRNVLRWLPTPGAASADPARFKDDRFLRDLEASGFIRELYPQGVPPLQREPAP
jgi:NitT/TauT family transport system substrate-binding protein